MCWPWIIQKIFEFSDTFQVDQIHEEFFILCYHVADIVEGVLYERKKIFSIRKRRNFLRIIRFADVITKLFDLIFCRKILVEIWSP